MRPRRTCRLPLPVEGHEALDRLPRREEPEETPRRGVEDDTRGGEHESQRFRDVWTGFPDNFQPERSLADAAYAGEDCLTTAKEHGATPLHGIRKDAKHTARPETNYQRLVNLATHWPNRFPELTGPRSLVETTIDMTKGKFGHQLRCRDPIARTNEIQAKQTAHNIRIITMRDYLVASE